MRNKIPYYLTSIVLFILLKAVYTLTITNDLYFLLKPTNTLVSLVTNSNANYAPNTGFYHTNLNIVIDKSCSGFNFWMICFIMLTFLSIRYINKTTFKFLTIPVILIVSYFITIFVNASRILFSILIDGQFKFFSIEKTPLHINWKVFLYTSPFLFSSTLVLNIY